MTIHFAHLSSLRPSYHHCIVHIVDGSPLSASGLAMIVVLFLILMFAILKIVALVT
jgi:hypothetical protein